MDRMHRICVAFWETGEWPEEWTFSTFIPLPTKGDRKQCANYRTIAVVSHASKFLPRIILSSVSVCKVRAPYSAGSMSMFLRLLVSWPSIDIH